MNKFSRDIMNCDNLSLPEKVEFASVLLKFISFSDGENLSIASKSDLKRAQECLEKAKVEIDDILNISERSS